MRDGANAGSRSQRWQAILELLAERGRLSAAETAEALFSSPATIRRDFAAMAERQLVTREHGGIVASSMDYGLPRHRQDVAAAARRRVADAAAALVRPGAVVALNGGRTGTEVARRISVRPELASAARIDKHVTIVTNALNVASELVLRPHIHTVCLGGVARAGGYQLTGPLTTAALDSMWVDLLVLNVDGITADIGTTIADEAQASVAARMIERAQRVVVVAVGAKVGRRAFTVVSAGDEVTHLITDISADPRHIADLRRVGVQVEVV
jgi:DeoR family transcriptional regulator of aga operon